MCSINFICVLLLSYKKNGGLLKSASSCRSPCRKGRQHFCQHGPIYWRNLSSFKWQLGNFMRASLWRGLSLTSASFFLLFLASAVLAQHPSSPTAPSVAGFAASDSATPSRGR